MNIMINLSRTVVDDQSYSLQILLTVRQHSIPKRILGLRKIKNHIMDYHCYNNDHVIELFNLPDIISQNPLEITELTSVSVEMINDMPIVSYMMYYNIFISKKQNNFIKLADNHLSKYISETNNVLLDNVLYQTIDVINERIKQPCLKL